MLIQDMPALATSTVKLNHTSEDCLAAALAPSLDPNTVQMEFNRQLELLIQQHKSYPSIVTWVSFHRRDTAAGQEFGY
jgi:hypothetical protein